MRRWSLFLLLAIAASAASCSSSTDVTHDPWGPVVTVREVLDGNGYTAELNLGGTAMRFSADAERTILTSSEAGLSLLYVENAVGSFGFQNSGHAWVPSNQAAPTWPTALLVPSYSDVLVAAAEAEPIDRSDRGLAWFRSGPLSLAELGLGDGLYLDYGLNEEGRVLSWSLGSEPGSATLTWMLRSANSADFELPDGVSVDGS